MDVITIQTEAYQLLMAKIDMLLNSAPKGDKKSLEWLTGKEVMNMLGITSRTLQSYRDTGVLGFSQVSRKKILYKRADVLELLEIKYNKPFKKH